MWIFVFATFFCGIGSVVLAHYAFRNREKGVSVWQDLGGSPLMVMFKPSLLTSTGRKYRIASFCLIGLYVVFGAVLGIISK
jgi:hypothetical protein